MADDPPEDAKVERRRVPGWGAVAALVIVMAVVVIVVASRAGTPEDPERDPLELADDNELRAVTGAVSAVIRASDEDTEERAIAALEAIHPRSPGAADLRDSCVTTYRNAHDAERATRQMRAMAPADGGLPPPERLHELQQLLERTSRMVSEARETHQRCIDLYETAARRLHIEPARRPRPSGGT